jgi:hypothetical protein
LNTDIALDDDHNFADMEKSIGYPLWNDPAMTVCHTSIPANGKRVINYPPGTGFALSLFPKGIQARSLYIAVSAVILMISSIAIYLAGSSRHIVLSFVVGFSTLYFMINPSKASYSIAPTMLICSSAGYLIAVMLVCRRHSRRFIAIGLLGLLLGISVNFRIANLFLFAGPAIFFVGHFLRNPARTTTLEGILFGGAAAIGVLPTLIANTINAGSPFSTTYGAIDASHPVLSFEPLVSYLSDLQGALVLIASAWAIWIVVSQRRRSLTVAAKLTLANLATSALFFLTHQIVTPYYLFPVAELSLWTLLFVALLSSSQRVNEPLASLA